MKTSHRPLTTNWSSQPTNERWQPSGLTVKPLDRPPVGNVPIFAWHRFPVFTSEDVKTVMLPCSPPQFRIPKKGPNAGKPVEIMRRIQFITRTVTGGDGVEYTFTNRSSKIKVSTGIKLTPAQVRDTFARRWPDQAAELADHLLNF